MVLLRHNSPHVCRKQSDDPESFLFQAGLWWDRFNIDFTLLQMKSKQRCGLSMLRVLYSEIFNGGFYLSKCRTMTEALSGEVCKLCVKLQSFPLKMLKYPALSNETQWHSQ